MKEEAGVLLNLVDLQYFIIKANSIESRFRIIQRAFSDKKFEFFIISWTSNDKKCGFCIIQRTFNDKKIQLFVIL